MALLSPAAVLEGVRLSFHRGQLRHLQRGPMFPLQQAQRTPLVVRAAQIKRRKEPSLDRVIDQNKKLKIARKIAEVLAQQEGLCMTLRELGKYRQRIGLTGGRRCVVLLRRFPGLFRVYDEGGGNIWFTFTREAEEQYSQERALKQTLEDLAVTKVQKLLMMAPRRRVRLENLTHVRRELGLPDDFKMRMVHQHPHLFRIVAEEDDVFVELTSWDPALAVSALEAKERLREARLWDASAGASTPAEGPLEEPLPLRPPLQDRTGAQRAAAPRAPSVSGWDESDGRREDPGLRGGGGALGQAAPSARGAHQGQGEGEEQGWQWEGETGRQDSWPLSASAVSGEGEGASDSDRDSDSESDRGRGWLERETDDVQGWEEDGPYREQKGPYSDMRWPGEDALGGVTDWASDSDLEEHRHSQPVAPWDGSRPGQAPRGQHLGIGPEGDRLEGGGAALGRVGDSADAFERASGDELAARAIAYGRRVVTSAIASASGTSGTSISTSTQSMRTGGATGWATDAGTTHPSSDWNEDNQWREGESADTPVPRRPPLRLPPGLKLPRKDMYRLRQFHSAPLGSPYLPPPPQGAQETYEVEGGQDTRGPEGAEGAEGSKGVEGVADPSSLDAERRWVAVVHELLSLTVEKRLLVDQLTHFRRDLKLTQRIHALLVRHPEYFYVSLKGIRHSVFLREAYSGGILVDKDALGDALEELRRLSHVRSRRQEREEGGEGEGEGEWGEQGEEESGGGDGTWEDWHHSPAEAPALIPGARTRGAGEKSSGGQAQPGKVPPSVLLARQARQAGVSTEIEKW